ncbi:hypothetical protein [Comamonas testosteroni]|uniref:hypothetical protein n=1 Tax=Comamonas testosteroni TaxID=285 RepID=UPI003918CBA6
MRDFNSDAHVEEWMQENGGIDGLRRALARGTFAGQNKTLASAWLMLYEKKQEEQAISEERSLLKRSVAAAERSAESAQQSARWALWAIVISLLTVSLSVCSSLPQK